MASPVTQCSLRRSNTQRTFAMVLYWISHLQFWTLTVITPDVTWIFFQALWCFLFRCGFTDGYISATSITKTIECKRCGCWTIRVRLSIYILSAHTDLRWSFRYFRCCRCCVATGGTPQLISISVPVESGHWLIRSCGVCHHSKKTSIISELLNIRSDLTAIF